MRRFVVALSRINMVLFKRDRQLLNLASFTQFISEALNNSDQVDVIYIDFWKAFDCRNRLIIVISYIVLDYLTD